MRTFIAVPLPEECKSLLGQLQDKLKPYGADVRWVAVTSIHLTLKFLGEIDPELIPKLMDALRTASAGQTCFQLSLRGLGGFPNLSSPRVVWCGLGGDSGKLSRLQAKVESACEGLGFKPENRPFSPHLTLGRVQGKRNLQRLLDYIKIAPDFEQAFEADRFHLYRSVLTPRGAVYSVLETIQLARA